MDAAGRDLVFTLRLFGGACDWSAVFSAAMVAAARRGLETGPAKKGHKPSSDERLTLQVSGARERDVTLPAMDASIGALWLEMLTPFCRRKSRTSGSGLTTVQHDVMHLLLGLSHRAVGLACWHGLDIELDSARLKSEARALALSALTELSDYQLRLGPAKDRRYVTGRLCLPSVTTETFDLLRLGTVMHAGADTTKGYGRFTLGVQ